MWQSTIVLCVISGQCFMFKADHEHLFKTEEACLKEGKVIMMEIAPIVELTVGLPVIVSKVNCAELKPKGIDS